MVDESTMTIRQLEALQSYIKVAVGRMRYREAASSMSQSRKTQRTGVSLTVGSYFRTVQQARVNVRKSIVTLLIGLWVGVVKPEDIRRLLDLASPTVVGLSGEEEDRFVVVLRALLQKIVM